MDRIIGKVVDIKNIYTAIINKGSNDGVGEGMRFLIYETGEELKDPETGESLGNMEYIKARVKANYVSEKYTIAETYDTYVVKNPLFMAGVTAAPFEERKERKTLPLSDETRNELLDSKRSLVVKKGDLVKQIFE